MERVDDYSFHDSLDESDIEDDSLNYIQNIPHISFFTGSESEEVHHDFEDDDEYEENENDNHLETITEEHEMSGKIWQEFSFLDSKNVFSQMERDLRARRTH